MLVFIIIAAVLIGIAYADYCLIDNTEHFGICFSKAAQVERERVARLEAEAARQPRALEPERVALSEMHPQWPRDEWLLQELEPVLELQEKAS